MAHSARGMFIDLGVTVAYEDLPPFLKIEQAQELTQLGRSQIYELTRRWRETNGREGIPCVQFGRALRVPTAALLRLADPGSLADGDDAA